MKIREYTKLDKKGAISLFTELQEYLASTDPLKRVIIKDGYGEKYLRDLLKKIKKRSGVILVAENRDKIIGLISGIVEKQKKSEALSYIKAKEGRVVDLVISKKYRGKNIGAELISKMEEYFKEKTCDISRVEAFIPNKGSYRFYKKMNYRDRVSDMIKKL